MTTQTGQDRQRHAARNLARRALLDLAKDAGIPVITRLAYRDGPTVRDIGPLAGADVSRQVELAAREHVRGYIRAAREAGHSWHEIGTVMRLVPDGDAQQTGDTVAEAAFTYAAGHPDTEHARRYGRSVAWHCGMCDRTISDHGLCNGPADDERGHAGHCTRLAATIAEDNAARGDLETEREAGQ